MFLSPASDFAARYGDLPDELREKIVNAASNSYVNSVAAQRVGDFRKLSLSLPFEQFLGRIRSEASLPTTFDLHLHQGMDLPMLLLLEDGKFYRESLLYSVVDEFVLRASRESLLAYAAEVNKPPLQYQNAVGPNGEVALGMPINYHEVRQSDRIRQILVSLSPPVMEKLLEIGEDTAALSLLRVEILRPRGLTLLVSRGILRLDKPLELLTKLSPAALFAMKKIHTMYGSQLSVEIILMEYLLACSTVEQAQTLVQAVQTNPVLNLSGLVGIEWGSFLANCKRRDTLSYLLFVIPQNVKGQAIPLIWTSLTNIDPETYKKLTWLGHLDDLRGCAKDISFLLLGNTVQYPVSDPNQLQPEISISSLIGNARYEMIDLFLTPEAFNVMVSKYASSLSSYLISDLVYGGYARIINAIRLSPNSVGKSGGISDDSLTYYLYRKYPWVTGEYLPEVYYLQALARFVHTRDSADFKKYFLVSGITPQKYLPFLVANLAREFVQEAANALTAGLIQSGDTEIPPLTSSDPGMQNALKWFNQYAQRRKASLGFGSIYSASRGEKQSMTQMILGGDLYGVVQRSRPLGIAMATSLEVYPIVQSLVDFRSLGDNRLPSENLRVALETSAAATEYFLRLILLRDDNVDAKLDVKTMRNAKPEVQAVLRRYGISF